MIESEPQVLDEMRPKVWDRDGTVWAITTDRVGRSCNT